jgi:hypothetical protein
MVLNDDAHIQMTRGALGFFASKLAPTGDCVEPPVGGKTNKLASIN